MPSCEKEGCEEPGRWHVLLDAADGSMDWWACYRHAKEFQAWVINETNRDGGNWGSVEVEYGEA